MAGAEGAGWEAEPEVEEEGMALPAPMPANCCVAASVAGAGAELGVPPQALINKAASPAQHGVRHDSGKCEAVIMTKALSK